MRPIKYHKWSTHLHRKRRSFPTAATQPPSPRTRLKKEKERHLPKKYKKQKKFQKELIIIYSSHVSFTRITKKNLRIDTNTHHQSQWIKQLYICIAKRTISISLRFLLYNSLLNTLSLQNNWRLKESNRICYRIMNKERG